MTEERLWITLPNFFELGYEIHGVVAEKLWQDMDYNRVEWQGWSSWDDEYSHENVVDIIENFINRHSALDIGQERIYTQLPIRTFFYSKPIDRTIPPAEHKSLYVRGAIWSNGMLWEEIDQRVGRNISIMLDNLTVDAFNYSQPSFSSDESVATLKKRLWEKRIEEEKEAQENSKAKTTSD